MDLTTIIALVKDYASAFKDWFIALPPENQIIYGLLFLIMAIALISITFYTIKYIVLGFYYIVYGFAWLVGNIVYGAIWITVQIYKAMIVGMIVMYYVLGVIFIKFPIVLIIRKDYSMERFGKELEYNIEDFINRVYHPKNVKLDKIPAQAVQA
jgi:hypothetical protein